MSHNRVVENYIYPKMQSVKICMCVDPDLHRALSRAANVSKRSKRSETRLRLEDSLTRKLSLKPTFTGLVPKRSMYITIDLDARLNSLLNEYAQLSGRTKSDEAIYLIQAHIDHYELFVTPELNQMRIR